MNTSKKEMEKNIEEMYFTTTEFLKYVTKKYNIKSYDEFICPHTKKLAEIIGFFEESKNENKI